MGAPPKCPGCGTKLDPEMESCPNCPMSFHDAPVEKTTLQGDNFRNFGIPIIIFGGLAAVLWTYSQYMWRVVESGVEDRPAGPASGPATQAPSDQSASAMIQAKVDELATKQQGGGGDAAAPTAPSIEDDEAGGGAVSIMAGGSGGRAEKPVTEWKMRGVVYDLITLKPVPGAKLTFQDNETSVRAVIQADANGRYRTILPPLQGRGYVVTIAKAGYETSYLNPGTEGVAEMPLENRKQLAKELASLVAEPASVEPNSAEPLVTNFHLAPK